MAKPKIRFKGYTDDWEQRKLGEVFKEYSEKGHTELPTLTIIQGGGTVKREDSDRNLMYDETNLSNYKMVRKDDFIVHLRSFEGGLEKASLDGIISPAYHTFHSDEADSRFYYPYFRSFEFIKHKLVPHVYGIRDGRSIDIEGMKSIEIPYTSLSEQRKIGDYLELLDHLITLHQRKCEETKKLKKYMLQKMFPQNGQTVPEIRFAGFTDAWEQRKLGDLVGIYDGVHQTPDYRDSGIMFLSVENIATLKSEKYISEEAFERDYNVYPEKGDILMTRIGDVGTTNVVETAEKVAFYVSLALLKPNGIDSYFLSNAMKTNDFQKGLRERTLVTAIPQKINKDEIGKINIFITNNDEEQKKIGAYFSSLDHLITLHQRKNIYFYEKVTLVWEQRKLGEIASSFEYGLNAAAKEYDGENKYIRITDIDDNTHEFLTYNLTSPDIDLTDVENYKLAEGDILFARTGASVGKSYIYRDSDGLVYYAGFLIRARIREEYDAEFVFQSTLTDKYNKYIAVTSQRSGQPGVNAQEYSEFEIRVPEKEEQTKIGTYFHNLDHLITLHQCKCHLLLKLLHNDWEQRKLGKLVDRVTRKNQDLVSELPLTISAQYGLIDQNEFFDKRVASKDVSGYYLIENGEFAYNKSTSTDAPWGAVKRLDRYENGVLSTLYIVFGIKENNPVDSDFLVSYYSTNLWHKGIHEIAAEGARNHGLLNIAPADFFETELTMPQDIEEQKKIGKYFEELERLITLHQHKCEQLQSMKKFMLQNMFV